MDWEGAFTFLGHAMGRPAARKALKGFIQQWVKDITWEEVQELIEEDKSWLDLDEEGVTRARNLFAHLPGTIESISFEDVLHWMEQANSNLLIQVLSDPKGAVWLRKNFDLAKSGLVISEPVIELVRVEKTSS